MLRDLRDPWDAGKLVSGVGRQQVAHGWFLPEGGQQRCAGNIAGQPHAIITSSRTKCSRINLGLAMVSSK